MERLPVQSSNIYSIGYDPVSQTLEVEFNNGSIYQYYGVPEFIYEDFMNADSKGSYLDHYIKKASYAYSQIA